MWEPQKIQEILEPKRNALEVISDLMRDVRTLKDMWEHEKKCQNPKRNVRTLEDTGNVITLNKYQNPRRNDKTREEMFEHQKICQSLRR